jgi:hypothetical protein
VNWVGPDLRGRILKKLATKPHRPWSTDVSAARTQRGRYIQKADRPRSRDWNFCVHLDQQELDAAYQFYHDWALAGLRSSSNAEWLEPSNNEDFTYGGQVPSTEHYGESNCDDHQIVGSSSTTEVTGELEARCAWVESERDSRISEILSQPVGFRGGQQEMAKPYSQDLRDRVIDAVKRAK